MKKKWPLFAGILLLVAGIVLRKSTELVAGPMVMILSGVILKTWYVVVKIRTGKYKPGWEMALLLIGLALFLSGLYLRSHQVSAIAKPLIISGLTLKAGFILSFILKTKSNNTPG